MATRNLGLEQKKYNWSIIFKSGVDFGLNIILIYTALVLALHAEGIYVTLGEETSVLNCPKRLAPHASRWQTSLAET